MLPVCLLTGTAVKEADKIDKDDRNTSASVSIPESAINVDQKAVEEGSQSVRLKRRVSGKGKPAHVLLSSFGIYLRGMFQSALAAFFS